MSWAASENSFCTLKINFRNALTAEAKEGDEENKVGSHLSNNFLEQNLKYNFTGIGRKDARFKYR